MGVIRLCPWCGKTRPSIVFCPWPLLGSVIHQGKKQFISGLSLKEKKMLSETQINWWKSVGSGVEDWQREKKKQGRLEQQKGMRLIKRLGEWVMFGKSGAYQWEKMPICCKRPGSVLFKSKTAALVFRIIRILERSSSPRPPGRFLCNQITNTVAFECAWISK